VSVDLTSLWHREVSVRGASTYTNDDFVKALDLVQDARLERLVSALYPLDRWKEAIEHAADAGRRGAVKIAFDLRDERGLS
jgi:threonine dehydrogenase-like Zn-dependent dehydrogenase